MSILKDFINGLTSGIYNKKELTEDDILKAIDNLPNEIEEIEKEPVPSWHKGATWTTVPQTPCWSEFKYLGKPEFKGLPDIQSDDRIYFTIPCGFEWDQSIKFWFITFPANCDNSGIKDFFTIINPVEV